MGARCIWIGVLTGAAMTSSWADDKAIPKDLEAIKGDWSVVAASGPDGKVVPKAELEKMQVTWTFQADGKALFSKKDGSGAEAKYTYTIDPSKDPKAIDLAVPDQKFEQFGIYKLEGEKLPLWLTASPSLTRVDRPKEFVAKGDKALLLELERPKK